MNITNTIMRNMRQKFKNANEAYEYFHEKIISEGEEFDNTKALFDVGFLIEYPLDNLIINKHRNWKLSYAKAEFEWYLSGDRNAVEIAKRAPIWNNMMDEDGNVMSNYGWQWERNSQLSRVVKLLKDNPKTRKAAISIYDGKEISRYGKDTPCTYAVQFTIIRDKLNMSVVMRSNDLWYGFCNDQYCFSMLQKLIARVLRLDVGTYHHFAHNLHLYNDKL